MRKVILLIAGITSFLILGNISKALTFDKAIASNVVYRVSGSGMSYPDPDSSTSMSLDITSSPLESTWLKYYYHEKKIHRDTMEIIDLKVDMVSASITGLIVNGDTSTITGTGTVNGTPGYTFTATITDGGPDAMGLEIRKPDGRLYYRVAPTALTEGNLTISVQ